MLTIKKSLTLAAAGIAVIALTGCAGTSNDRGAAKNGYQKQKVVYHMNDINWGYRGLKNMVNHLNALGDENLDAVMVFHSSGGFILVDGKTDKKGHSFGDQIQGLANRGVKFALCANTVRGKKIPKDKINLNAEIVPSGVAEVAELQHKGYVYIKP
ncbi:DsrE family protein [Sulfuriflexus sp.]|uniref:DsrE family protein n=1 Tax=Sulfuriflexus sp. TaxID=2015443 RepID=UPI0028CE46EC|nr:DsrE family protein [Sulfuriflexus sp.]MDT8403053.1 DsrE family protein [Sulfuriflexus sp.]